jgi:hypothetical protein
MIFQTTKRIFSFKYVRSLVGFCVVISFFVPQLSFATISNGANALDVIGQYSSNDGGTVSYTQGNADDAPNLYGFGGLGDSLLPTEGTIECSCTILILQTSLSTKFLTS